MKLFHTSIGRSLTSQVLIFLENLNEVTSPPLTNERAWATTRSQRNIFALLAPLVNSVTTLMISALRSDSTFHAVARCSKQNRDISLFSLLAKSFPAELVSKWSSYYPTFKLCNPVVFFFTREIEHYIFCSQ